MKANEINESLIGKRILISESILKHEEPRTDDLVEAKVEGFDTIRDLRYMVVKHNPVTFFVNYESGILKEKHPDGEQKTTRETMVFEWEWDSIQLSEREIHYNNEKRTKYVINGWEYMINAIEKYFNTTSIDSKTWHSGCDNAQLWDVIVSPKKQWFIDIVNKLLCNVDAKGNYYPNEEFKIDYTVHDWGRAKRYEYNAITTDREWARQYIITIKPYLNNNTHITVERVIYENIQ